MQSDEFTLQVKRSRKKILSQKVAIMLKEYVEANFPEDHRFLRKMIRQIRCSSYLEVLSNGSIKAHFCKEKTCLVCNSIRAAKFLDKYKNKVEEKPIIYHNVLSIKNPLGDDLKYEIDKMFKFFNQSSLKRNRRFVELNKIIGFVRTFETTFNSKAKSYNIHFHCLIAGDREKEVVEYGKLLIDYWLKYFGNKANKKAQYLEKQEKSILENFKYLFKLKDITKNEIPMLYTFLKAVQGRRLFSVKNIISNEKDISEYREKKFADALSEKVASFHFHIKAKNWIDSDTGEIFITDSKEKCYINEMTEIKNLRELKKYFSALSI